MYRKVYAEMTVELVMFVDEKCDLDEAINSISFCDEEDSISLLDIKVINYKITDSK